MSEHRWSRLRFSPLRLTTAAVFGSIDCALQFHSASSTTPPRRYGCRSVPPRHLRSVAARGAPLHLRLQTIFDGYALAFPRHRSCVTVSVRFAPLSTRNLRLLFRPVRTGIFTPSSNRRTAAIRHHPPTHKRTDERTEISPWHSLIFRRGQEVGGFDCFPHPERGFRYGFRPLITSVACIPGIADSEHFWPRLRFSPLRLKTASAFGSIDCSLRSLQSSVTFLASCGFTTASTPCGHKLSSHFHSHFSPDTSGCAYGVGFVPITVCPETSACFSEPSMTCCRASSSIHPCAILTASLLPPIEVEAAYIPRPRHVSHRYPSTTQCPPQAPMDGDDDALTPLRQTANRFTHSEFAYGLGQGQVGRLSNRERI